MVVEVLLREKLPRTILSRGPGEMGPQALHQDPERGWDFFKGAPAQRRPGEDEVGGIRVEVTEVPSDEREESGKGELRGGVGQVRKWVGLEETLAEDISLVNFGCRVALQVGDSVGLCWRSGKRKEGRKGLLWTGPFLPISRS